MGLFSKAAAHGLAALIDIRCSRYVRSSINRTGADDLFCEEPVNVLRPLSTQVEACSDTATA